MFQARKYTNANLETTAMTTNEMLNLIMFSQNEECAKVARAIILEGKTPDNYKRSCGGFMRAVFDGDFERVLMMADNQNYYALTGKSRIYNW